MPDYRERSDGQGRGDGRTRPTEERPAGRHCAGESSADDSASGGCGRGPAAAIQGVRAGRARISPNYAAVENEDSDRVRGVWTIHGGRRVSAGHVRLGGDGAQPGERLSGGPPLVKMATGEVPDEESLGGA